MMRTKFPKVLHPIMDRVVVRPDEERSQTEGGLYIPDEAKKRPHRGTVLAVGRGRYLENGTLTDMEPEEGEIVYFTEFAGHKIEVDGEELWVMNEADILCIELKDDDWDDCSDELHKS